MRFYLRNDFPDRPGVYYICWTDSGRPRRLSTRSRDHGAAQKALAEYILEHERPRDQRASEVTVVAVMLRYWQHYARHLASKDTAKQVLGHVTEFLPMMTVAELDKHAQRQFVEQLRGKRIADNTIARRIGVLQAALNWAHEQGQLAAVPPQKLHRPESRDGPGQRPATLEELQALFGTATHEHRRRFLMLAIGTLGRPISLLDLTWDRVDFETHTIDLANPRVKRTKKRRARVPMAPMLEVFLKERKGVGPVVQWHGRPLKGHRTSFEALAEEAGVTVGAYALRKAAATWMRREQVPRWDVQAMLGHATKGETDKYAHWEPSYMREAAASIERLLRAIGAPWLASYLPVPSQPASFSLQVPVAIGETGGRTWDRTTDPYHVKVEIEAAIQSLTVANDD